MNSTRDRIDQESQKDPERLEREIDQQRDSIGQIVSALESKLSPGEIVDRLMSSGKGSGGEMVRNLGNVVKANPMPALLATAGLLWLYSSRNETAATRSASRMEHSYGRYDASSAAYASTSTMGAGSGRYESEDSHDHDGPGLKERASHLREGVSDKWHDTTSRVGSMAHSVGDRAKQMGGSLRQQTHRATDGFTHMLHENPMAAGAIAIAVGALLGAALPNTEKENELMGETGDRIRSKAGEVADSARSKGSELARELGQAAGGSNGNGNGGSMSSNGGSQNSAPQVNV